jgi:hypothetical protein
MDVVEVNSSAWKEFVASRVDGLPSPTISPPFIRRILPVQEIAGLPLKEAASKS